MIEVDSDVEIINPDESLFGQKGTVINIFKDLDSILCYIINFPELGGEDFEDRVEDFFRLEDLKEL